MSRWFRAATKAHTPTMTAAEEDQHLQHVESALLQLLNDNIAEADKALKQGQSSYHHLGRGISSFIASMLGAEKELLKDAAAILQDAENRTWDDIKKAQREPGAFRSEIYPPGTEYLLCYSISQLTSAICHVMSGSVTEAIKGFYKLRKAYLTLDGIMEIESKHLKAKMAGRRGSFPSIAAASTYLSRQETKKPQLSSVNAPSPAPVEKDDPLHEKPLTRLHNGPNGNNGNNGNEPGVVDGDLSPYETNTFKQAVTRTQSRLLDVEPASVGIQSHTDIFIHSGTRLCYGLLLVLFSMIENPLFTKILYIVGFKGDRERGTRYLWQSARFNNFNSAIAGIVLLGYYNGLVGFCDILPTDPAGDDDLAGYPKARCEVLLSDMRKRYPDSKLWKLEEARMHAYNRNLDEAVRILADNSDSNMKQIATINMFEMSLTAMYFHDYELCARSWIQCAELSSWSPTLYAYMTGVAYLELYRDLREKDQEGAKVYKSKATEYIKKGPPLAGRQKVMSKELPFDIFIKRKVQKWEDRANAWGVDLVDATGTSPITEMIFLWNGMKKQSGAELQKSLDALQWNRTSHPQRFVGDLDEQAINIVLSACIVRNIGKYDEARSLLKDGILNHERHEFKGPQNDDWTNPTAHYEMAALAWAEKDLEGADHRAKVVECESWLEKVQKWDAYVLDTRLSMKITTSIFTVKRHKSIMGL